MNSYGLSYSSLLSLFNQLANSCSQELLHAALSLATTLEPTESIHFRLKDMEGLSLTTAERYNLSLISRILAKLNPTLETVQSSFPPYAVPLILLSFAQHHKTSDHSTNPTTLFFRYILQQNNSSNPSLNKQALTYLENLYHSQVLYFLIYLTSVLDTVLEHPLANFRGAGNLHVLSRPYL